MQYDERTEEALHSPASLIYTPLPGHFTDHSPPPPLTLCTPPHSHTTLPLSSHYTHSSSHYTPLALTLHSPHPHPPHSSPAPLSLVGPLKLHKVRVLLRQCSPVHGQMTLTANAREERHGALTRGPGGGRGKGCVHRRQSGVQGGGPGGVSPIVGGGVHGRGRRRRGSSLPCLDQLQGAILQCCMMTATTQVPLRRVCAYVCSCVHGLNTQHTERGPRHAHGTQPPTPYRWYLSPPATPGIPHVAASVGDAQCVWVPHVKVCQGEVPQLRVVGQFHLEELLASTVQLHKRVQKNA